MKRLFFVIVLVMLVYWIMARHRAEHIRPAGQPGYGNNQRYARHGAMPRRTAATARHQTRQALDEARHVLDEARDAVRQALDEAREEVRQAFDEVGGKSVSNDYPRHAVPPPALPRPPAFASEEADGLPVPIVPGTRVSETRPQPPSPPHSVIAIHYEAPLNPEASPTTPPSAAVSSGSHLVTGLISATEERAKSAARRKLQEYVVNKLDPEVPASWTPPPQLLDAMVLETRIKPIVKPYGTLYEAEFKIDDSPQRRARLVDVYNRELVEQRLMTLGGTLAFILTCLGAVSSYIRTDEATKGYYTNRLRMLAAAGIGAAGVVIYQLVT